MKRFLLIFGVLVFSVSAFAQTAARYDFPLLTTQGNVRSGTLPTMFGVTNATIAVCSYPATLSAGMCTNTVTTYTDATLATACPSSAQLTVNGSPACVSTSGLQGSFGFWYDAGSQTHLTYTVKTSWGTFGPYDIVRPIGSGASTNAANTWTNTNDNSLVNPTRTGLGVGNIVGSFDNYFWTGTIPGTSPYNFGQLNHFALSNYFLDSAPGCYGFSGTCFNSQHGWDNTEMIVSGAGGTNMHTDTGIFYAVGDHIGRVLRNTSYGGSIDGGGPEGTKGWDAFIQEASTTWTGAVATSHGGAGQTTLTTTCTTACGGSGYGIAGNTPAGLGQGMIVLDEQATTATGQITAITNGSGDTPGTMTVNITGGLSNLAVSTCEATLNSQLTPLSDPSGSGTTPMTFTVTDVAGACTTGGLIQFEGFTHEQAIITSASTPSSGQQTITANIREVHGSGTYLFQNPASDFGLFADIVANHNGALQYPVEILGVQSISSPTAVLWWRYWYAGEQPSFTGFPYGNMVVGAGPGVASLSNTSGTVTFTIFSNWNINGTYWQSLNGAPAIYFTGSVNSAFNGPCTNVHVSFPAGNGTGSGTCTQAASTGQTSSSAVFSFTDTTLDNPYGNSRVNFYQGAAIIDPQDYSNPITAQGKTNYPVDGLQFEVEPNSMPLAAADALVEEHSAPQFHAGVETVTAYNNECYFCDGRDISINGIYQGSLSTWFNNKALGLSNLTALSAYQYFGGTKLPTPAVTVQGLFANFLDSQYPPAFQNSILNVRGCPPSSGGCNDSTYWYGLYSFIGNGGNNYTQYFPSTNTMVWNGPQTFNNGISIKSGQTVSNTGMLNGCAQWASGQLGSTGTGCGGGSAPTLETNGTSNTSQSILNFVNPSSFNGLSFTWSNPTSGNETFVASGTLNNAGLTNSATTVNGQTCTLGSTCTVPLKTNSVSNTSQAGINLETSTTNAVGLTVTPTNTGTNVETFEVTGGSYTGNASTASNLSGTPTLPNGTSATTQTVGDNSTKLATDAFVLANASGNVSDGSGTSVTPEFAESTSTVHTIQYRTASQALADMGAAAANPNQTPETVSFTAVCNNSYRITSGTVTVSLPASAITGCMISVQNVSATAATISSGTITYNGPTSLAQYQTTFIQYDGTNFNGSYPPVNSVLNTSTAAGAFSNLLSNPAAANYVIDCSSSSACATTAAAASATTDTTNASNISSGTLAAARLPAALSSSTSVNGTSIPSSATLTVTIASGTVSLGTSAIASGACATVVTSAATGGATTDVIQADFNADPTAIVGYGASASGAVLTIYKYVTANTANFKVCNSTSASITPGAATLNWRITR